MLKFKIDETSCTKCGLCAAECPVGIIEMEDLPEIKSEKEAACMKCQHCLAVCPTGSLSILNKRPENSVKNTRNLPDVNAMSEMIKTRRSIRKYKKEALDKSLINELLETASYAPTGHNSNGVHFSVVDDVDTMHKLRQMTYNSIKEAGETGTLNPNFAFIYDFQKLWESQGIDVVFRDAPHLLVASAPQAGPSPLPDALIALSYFELLANSHGIGTLWNGMVKWAINDIDPNLRKLIGIPEDHVIGYVMLFGKPGVKYVRSIQSEGVNINNIQLP